MSAASDLNDFSRNAVVDGAPDTLIHAGFANIDQETLALVGYIGRLDLDVNFASDALTGSVSSFASWTDAGPTGVARLLCRASLALNGALTGTNETPGGGVAGTAVCPVDRYNFNMTMDGNILGATTRRGVVLSFGNIVGLGSSVGIATC